MTEPTPLQEWQAEALTNVRRFFEKYAEKPPENPLPLVDVLRFRINALLASEPNQLSWQVEERAELQALIQAYQHMLAMEQRNLTQLEQTLATSPEDSSGKA